MKKYFTQILVGVVLACFCSAGAAVIKVYVLEEKIGADQQTIRDIKRDTQKILCMLGEQSRCLD